MYKKILLPVDLSAEHSWAKALPTALRLAGPEDGVLHVVTVVPDFGMSVVGTFFEKGYEDKALTHVGEELKAWVAQHVPADVEVHPHVLLGRVYDEVISAANRLDVDAIVLASHRPELSDYLIGPNAARIVRHARQSVFVVREG
ncbi:universal stress protein [Maritalea mobilis]|uniref:Universal stress protein n=1 Tax=[Roseibacterium] beibuensis TaxID=1193142 RepID=A0ABP9LKS5_9RHOB|nr:MULTISPECIES: universal stress protein [Alphaproteobacteria]MBY6202580.1 universal stress protein [Maritalea mobilis]MCS6623355.1 universal stress protein [Roseibacterium beibuensis]